MKKLFVATRGELTEQLLTNMNNGYACYRVKTGCNCHTTPKNPEMNLKANQRNAVFVVEDDKILKVMIRCKKCKKKNE